MSSARTCLLLLLLCSPAGCAAGEADLPAPVPEPDAGLPAEDSLPPEPAEPEPEVSLEERWRAPFAVQSSGRPAPRPERTVVVVRPVERTPAPPPPAAAPAPDTAGAGEGTAAAAPEPDRIRRPRESAPEPARTHRVEWGETWYGIARRYVISPATLQAANPGVDPARLRAGTVLRIPAAGASARAGQRTHQVGPGDTLWGIARRYGVSLERLRAANGLEGDRVRLGQTLIIPSAEEAR